MADDLFAALPKYTLRFSFPRDVDILGRLRGVVKDRNDASRTVDFRSGRQALLHVRGDELYWLGKWLSHPGCLWYFCSNDSIKTLDFGFSLHFEDVAPADSGELSLTP